MLGDEDKQYTLVSELGGEFDKRSEPEALPNEFSVVFKAGNDDVTLNLKRNLHINHNAPVTFGDGTILSSKANLEVNQTFFWYSLHSYNIVC